MKLSIYKVLLAITIGFTQCCKEKPNTKTDILGLPRATQTGANTLGFLLNGVPWTPAGNNGTANLSISFDPGFNNGVFGISAYRIISGNRSSFGIGISDSLNLLAIPLVRKLTSTSIYSAAFSKFDSCVLDSYYDSVSSSGSLTISKLDRIGGVISGEFNFKLSGLGCDTVFVTQGRFDMKF